MPVFNCGCNLSILVPILHISHETDRKTVRKEQKINFCSYFTNINIYIKV